MRCNAVTAARSRELKPLSPLHAYCSTLQGHSAVAGAAAAEKLVLVERRAAVPQFVGVIDEDADAAAPRSFTQRIFAAGVLGRTKALADDIAPDPQPFGRGIEAINPLWRQCDLYAARWPKLLAARSKRHSANAALVGTDDDDSRKHFLAHSLRGSVARSSRGRSLSLAFFTNSASAAAVFGRRIRI